MYKTILGILLFFCLMFSVCESQEINNEPSPEQTNQIIIQKEHEFNALDSCFCITLPEDWFLYKDVTPLQTKPSRQQIAYATKQEDVTTIFIIFSKKDVKKDLETKFTNSCFKGYINKLKSDGEDFEEFEHPIDYEDENKTIKRFICDATMQGLQLRYIFSLIEFKDSDKFIVCSQACMLNDWDMYKEPLLEIVDSVCIKQDNK